MDSLLAICLFGIEARSYWRSGCVLARCPEVRVHEMNESTRWHPEVPLYNFTLSGLGDPLVKINNGHSDFELVDLHKDTKMLR